MTSKGDITERLLLMEQGRVGPYTQPATIRDARETIERLQAAKRASAKIADERSYENVGLRAENERLRAAHRRIMEICLKGELGALADAHGTAARALCHSDWDSHHLRAALEQGVTTDDARKPPR